MQTPDLVQKGIKGEARKGLELLTKLMSLTRKVMTTMYRVSSQPGSKLPKKTSYYGSPTSVTPLLAGALYTDEIGDEIGQRAFTATPFQYPPFDKTSAKGEYGAYADEYQRSVENPQGFWGEAAKSIHWFQSPTQILANDPRNPYSHQWFTDGTTNTAYNCLDVHVNKGHGDRVALIYDSPVTGIKKQFSYHQLLNKVSIFAGALKDELGVEPGDRIVIYMPMIPESIIAMVRNFLCRVIVKVLFSSHLSILIFSWHVPGSVQSTQLSLEVLPRMNLHQGSQTANPRSSFRPLQESSPIRLSHINHSWIKRWSFQNTPSST